MHRPLSPFLAWSKPLSSRTWRLPATLLAAGALVVSALPAFADNIQNDIGATGKNVVTLSGASVSTTINFTLQITGNPSGCDVSTGNASVYDIVLTAPNEGPNASVTTNVSSVTFNACAVAKPVIFTATSVGTKLVSLDHASGPILNENPAKFTLTVNPPAVTNTPPTVTVGGVTATSYEFGAVPAAVCNVSDAEDVDESAEPQYSGTLDSYGLGTETVTCEYTDGGGLSDDDSVTYTVVDTTDPSISAPGDRTIEATGPDGAVDTFEATATDAVGVASVDCVPPSGSTFPLGDTLVTCTATDVAGNTDEASFTVTVVDTGDPSITAPDDVTAEATSSAGAVVTFADPVVSDTVDQELFPTCDPASGSTFPLGETVVTCTVTDDSGNSSDASFTVTVVDTTPPTVEEKGDVTEEATGPDGAAVVFDKPTASDTVDGATEVVCDAESGDTFPLGTTTVSCSSTDAAGNTGYGSFDVIVEDTTAPVIDGHDDVTAEATGPDGASVEYTTPAANDLVDGSVAVSCDPAPGVTVAVGGSQLVTCTATDAAGNSSQSSFTLYVVDTTAPTLVLPANISTGATSASGAVVTYTATATDLVDGDVTPDCLPASGSTFAPGTTTVSCTATDSRGNTSDAGTFDVTVSFTFNGFFAPVDNGILNTIKGGQSVPIKWAIPNGSGGFISSLGVVERVTQSKFTCTAGAPTDAIEAPTSGATSLRYDTTANQYIYNWQSPKGANSCYKVTVYLTDGTSKSASFMTK